MKKDINKLMRNMKVSAIYAAGKSSRDATMYYLLNGANSRGHPRCFSYEAIDHLTLGMGQSLESLFT